MSRPPTRRELQEADETIVYLQSIIHDLLGIVELPYYVLRPDGTVVPSTTKDFEDRAVIIKKAEAVLPPRLIRKLHPHLREVQE